MEPAYASFGQAVRRAQRRTNPRRRHSDRNRTCWRCRTNKARCDGRLPCGRCFDNAFPCRPPPSDGDPAGGAGGVRRAGRGAARARGRGGGPDSDIVPSVYQRAEYGPMVQSFLSSFDRLHHAALLDEHRIVPIIAQWRASSARLGHDGTDSLTSELERRLRASREAALEGATQKRVGEAVTFDEGQWEGEVADAIMSASSASKRRLTPVELSEVHALICTANELCSSTLLRYHDDGMTPTLFLGLFDKASEAGAAEGTTSLGWGRQFYPATNQPFAAAFQTAPELIEASIRYRVPSFLLLATLCAPDDRGAFFGAIVHALFGKEGRPGSSDFIKMATRTGNIDLYLLRAARLELDEGRQEETLREPREAVALSFLRLPPSRHISLRPHTFSSFSPFATHNIYRKGGVLWGHAEEAAVQPGTTGPAPDPVLGAAGAPAPGQHVRVPAIATLSLGGSVLEQEGVCQQLLVAAPFMSGIFEQWRPLAVAEQEGEGEGHGGLLKERASSASAASPSSSEASSSEASLVSRVIKAQVAAPPAARSLSTLHAPLPPPLNVAPTSVVRLDDASAMERLTPALYRLAGRAASSSSDGALLRSPAMYGGGGGGEEGEGRDASDVENRYAYHDLPSRRGLPPVPVLSGASMEDVFSGSEDEKREGCV